MPGTAKGHILGTSVASNCLVPVKGSFLGMSGTGKGALKYRTLLDSAPSGVLVKVP